MSTGSKKGGGSGVTSGYRYYFSVLAGICRGPIDEIFLIKSDNRVFWDGSPRKSLNIGDLDIHDPAKPFGFDETGLQPYSGGTVTDNRTVLIAQPDLYGGEKSEGGIVGLLSLYFGAKNQIIAAGDYVKYVMGSVAGLRLSEFRGVVTAFFDGEVCANNPYPKAWTYRVRRALKGWDGDVWYPERAVIKMADSALPIYYRGAADTGVTTMTTIIRDGSGVEQQRGAGGSSGSATVETVTSNYQGATVTTYSSLTGTVTNYAVPLIYNDIYAMNPAHIIYECATNRDWGRGLDRALIGHESFSDSANQLWSENFGLCMKWSRTEDVDVFVQMVLDHIGGVVYTDKITGLLNLRLVRGGYTASALPVFDYNSGLIEVTSADVPTNDVVANEVIVKYRSPVLDADREARSQNIASMDSLGCVYSTTRDYSGIPTSDLALRVADRDLKIFSGGWRKVELKLDRRAYALNPGDVIVVNAPDRHLDNMVIRIATVAENAITDGTIDVTGAQDIFGLPTTPMIQPQSGEYLTPNRYPTKIQVSNASEATYRDVYIHDGSDSSALVIGSTDTHLVFLAAKPTASSLNYRIQTSVGHYGSSVLTPFVDVATASFAKVSFLTAAIGTTDTVIAVGRGDILPGRVAIGSALSICHPYETAFSQEFVRLDAISRDVVTGQVYLTVARGCVDTPAVSHPAGSRVWAYDDTGIADPTTYTKYDGVQVYAFNHTTLGDAATPAYAVQALNWRVQSPYSGADFRVNGYPRDATPSLTGTLEFTWKHRDRTKIEDQLVGETEEGGSIEPMVGYTVYLQGTRNDGTGRGRYVYLPSTASTTTYSQANTSTNISITQSELNAAGIGDGPMFAFLVTYRWDHGTFPSTLASYRWPRIYFSYGVEPDTSAVGDGFNFDFDQAFDGVSA